MSEKPLNRDDDLQEDVQDTTEDTESGLNEAGDRSMQVPWQSETR